MLFFFRPRGVADLASPNHANQIKADEPDERKAHARRPGIDTAVAKILAGRFAARFTMDTLLKQHPTVLFRHAIVDVVWQSLFFGPVENIQLAVVEQLAKLLRTFDTVEFYNHRRVVDTKPLHAFWEQANVNGFP